MVSVVSFSQVHHRGGEKSCFDKPFSLRALFLFPPNIGASAEKILEMERTIRDREIDLFAIKGHVEDLEATVK